MEGRQLKTLPFICDVRAAAGGRRLASARKPSHTAGSLPAPGRAPDMNESSSQDASAAATGAAANQIVFVNRFFHPDESATSRMLSDLAFRLARQGLSVTVITSRLLYNEPGANLPRYEIVQGVTVHRVATATQGRARLFGRALDYASFHLAAFAKLLVLVAPGDVVVAKTDPPLLSVPVSLAAVWKRAVLVNWLQDLFPEVAAALAPRFLPNWLAVRLLRARDRSLNRAAMNVVLGDGMRDRLLTRGIESTRIRVVPNWADVDAITPCSRQDSRTRRALGLENHFVIGYSGNLGRAHEFDTLLGAARLLEADGGFAFLITGAGAKFASLRDAAQRAGLACMHFQDYQPRELLSDSLAAADVHVVSLLPVLEGLIVPSKLYGVLAAGRPAIFIGDTHGEVARTLAQHGCGLAVEVGDSEQLANELRALRSDPQRVAALGCAGRALAVDRYTSEHAVSDWLSFLKAIAPAAVERAQRTLKYATNA
jgi:colanic acid biosynthesis glycosyl transferase WcaI